MCIVLSHPLSYDNDSTQQIEESYKANRAIVPLSHGFFATCGGYTVDLSRMTQTRDSTGFQRPIRRIPSVTPLQQDDEKEEREEKVGVLL